MVASGSDNDIYGSVHACDPSSNDGNVDTACGYSSVIEIMTRYSSGSKIITALLLGQSGTSSGLEFFFRWIVDSYLGRFHQRDVEVW